jgi:hypothetical protein
VICLHRKVATRDQKLVYWFAGGLAALSVLLEKKPRRAELALYVLPRAADSLWYILNKRHMIPNIQNTEVSLSLSLYIYIYIYLSIYPSICLPVYPAHTHARYIFVCLNVCGHVHRLKQSYFGTTMHNVRQAYWSCHCNLSISYQFVKFYMKK